MASTAESDERFTAADYMALEDDQRYELIAGALVMAASPNRAHQRAVGQFFAALDRWVESHDLGYVFVAPVDVVLADDTVLQPDILFVQRARWHDVDDGHGLTGPPDLVVEVLSPSTALRDRSIERDLYLRAGVPWLCLIDIDLRLAELFTATQTSVEPSYRLVRTQTGDDTLSLDEVIPGFEVGLDALWFDPERFAGD